MAKITIEIPDGKVELVKKSLDYKDKIMVDGVEVDNPETPAVFFRGWITKQVKRAIRIYEAQEHRKTLQETDVDDIV